MALRARKVSEAFEKWTPDLRNTVKSSMNRETALIWRKINIARLAEAKHGELHTPFDVYFYKLNTFENFWNAV